MSDALQEAVAAYAAELAPRVRDVVRQGAQEVAVLRDRLRSGGLGPEALGDDEALTQGLRGLPVLTKDELLARQHAEPPFGGLLAPGAVVRRVFQSPGPIYEPQLDGPDPWRWAPALEAVGIGPGDTVLNCFGYHLSPAGAMFEEGCLARGATILPGGIGNQDLQARAVADLGVTAYVGLPSYLKALVDRYEAAGLPAEKWRLGKALVTAEPLPDSLRTALRERVPTVLSAYGTAEAGLVAYEEEPGEGLVPAPGVHVEVCDLATGEPVADGEGQVLVTVLRSGYPLVRFGTGDLSAWVLGPGGRPRLAGVLGRVGEAVKVRGMFLHPRQAEAVMNGLADVADWGFVVDRVDHRDELRCDIVPAPGADADALATRVRDAIRSGLRFGTVVRIVDSLPSDHARLTDERKWD